MVELRVKDFVQLTMLQCRLMAANIEYTVAKDDGKYGIPTPYLIVDGTPLDEHRAYKWLEERNYE